MVRILYSQRPQYREERVVFWSTAPGHSVILEEGTFLRQEELVTEQVEGPEELFTQTMNRWSILEEMARVVLYT